MPRLLISAAHTLENPGQIYQDLKEADLTRKILKKVIPYLEAHKITFQPVPLDLPLLQRIEWINSTGYTEEQGDIFIEIHINDGGKRGIEAWYRGASDPTNKSQKLSESILNGICKYTGYQSQGAKSEYDHELGSLLILNQTNPIGTAVECLFIDNPEDVVILKDDAKLDQLAKSIADSINDYIKGVNQPVAQPVSAQAQPSSDQPSAPLRTSVSPSIPFGNAIGSAPSPFMPSTSQPFTPSASPSSPFPSFGPPKPFGSTPGLGGGAASGSKSLVMDREERKEMIKKVYKKVLGKEPNQSDLNYHLNTGTNEDDLTKKLLESPDHEKLIKDATEAKDVKDKFQKMEVEIAQFKGASNDLRAMHDNLNRLLQHKNMLIARLQQELANNKILLPGQKIDSIHNQNKAATAALNAETRGSGQANITQKIMKVLRI